MKTFYTSDNHFFHKNIIRYCTRPYADVEEMNADMIARWNAVVGDEDLVYHLGDFGFSPVPVLATILAALKGKKILIRGNHDRGVKRMLDVGFSSAHEHLSVDGWLLIHNPADAAAMDANRVLCGHVHEVWARKKNYMDCGIDMINVGVDVRDFTPRTLDELTAEGK
jgi:calcineurin-like phosphoesterase family protein